MPDIIIPEAVWHEFLQSLHAKITKDRNELTSELVADLALLRARLEVQTRAAFERKLRAAEEELERKQRAAEEGIERWTRALQDKLQDKLQGKLEEKMRAAEDEIARLRQLERLRQTAAIERGEWPQ